MALPPTFPQPPGRPPPEQPFLDPVTGAVTLPWLQYFEALDRFNVAVRAKLDTL